MNTETLGTEDVINNDTVIISIDGNEHLQIKSSLHHINKVLIYDILGKKVYENDTINSTVFSDKTITKSQRVLFVKTTLSNGVTLTNKILF